MIFVLGFFALIAGTAFVVDGGNVMAQQRATQNGCGRRSSGRERSSSRSILMGGSSATGCYGNVPDNACRPVGPRGLQGRLRLGGCSTT